MGLKIKEKTDGKTNHYEISSQNNKFNENSQSLPQNLPKTSYLPFKSLYLTTLYFLRSIFLPEGYPKTVSADYLEYQIWDSFQALCSSLTGTLSTHAILKGVGVGDGATAAAASVRWLLRDGSGMIGRILFAWWQGSNLDANSKTFRLVADILNDFAILIEILSPAFPDYFLLLICIGNIMKAIVGVAGGATRASFTEHQARYNNMADVSAKDGSQETALGLIGIIIGVIVIPFIAQSQYIIWICYSIFTFFHIFCNFKAVSVLQMETFNQQRLEIVTSLYLEKKIVISQIECAKKERNFSLDILLGMRKPSLYLGAPFKELFDDQNDLEIFKKLYPEERYFLGISKKKKDQIVIVLMDKSDSNDLLKSFFQYLFIRFEVKKNKKNLDKNLVEKSIDFCRENFDEYLKKLQEKGWETSKLLLNAKDYRFEILDDK